MQLQTVAPETGILLGCLEASHGADYPLQVGQANQPHLEIGFFRLNTAAQGEILSYGQLYFFVVLLVTWIQRRLLPDDEVTLS